MNKAGKIAIIAALVVAVVIVIVLKQGNRANSELTVVEPPGNVVTVPQAQEPGNVESDASMALPRLVDLGAGKCIPCKMMAPVLEELRQEYAGRLRVDVFDIEKNPDLVAEYKVWVIPTQIFFDASGTELFRHEGFMSKEDILAKWRELGVELARAK
ncbi:MAG: thiol reductase thioredoxin [Planctomycetes bacterium B3_Pla]|nr:MAG: thiol reductase thioredoxin [Planctomycetes bacterium B3_Pla]